MIEEREDLGTLKVGVKKMFYVGIDKRKIVKNIHISCGCTKAEIVFRRGEIPVRALKVMYTPGAVPRQRLSQGWYKAKQTVTLTYEDESKFQLNFTAKIIK